MSKRGTIEVFQTKISRNDRFAQMSQQEKLIEQKKREIQAKLEQKQKLGTSSSSSGDKNTKDKPATKSPAKPIPDKKSFNFNTFSNDGSFLNQFKQMKVKKDCRTANKLFRNGRDNREHNNNEESRSKSKWKRELTPKENNMKNAMGKQSRFSHPSDKVLNVEPKININASYSNLITQQQQQQFDSQMNVVSAQEMTGQPLLKNMVSTFGTPASTSVITAPPMMMNVPPPQLQIHMANGEMPVELCPATVLTTVSMPPQASVQDNGGIINVPPPCMPPPLDMATMPPPNPLQVHSLSQAEPLNALTMPVTAPLQVQNIPPPSPIQLNEIPNPKPLDILSIPTPSEEPNAEFIKNVPPPNKAIPPPQLPEHTCLPPPPILPPTSIPPPQAPQSILVPPPSMPQMQNIPPPSMGSMPSLMNTIPPLMAQPIMPPSVSIVPPPPPQMSVPPPIIPPQVPAPAAFNQLLPVPNVPPPPVNNRDANAGSAEYEAMASVGRMVAQCGPGIEDVVRQRKNQDPSLWFLFNKNSAAYKQYQQLVDSFKAELNGGSSSSSKDDDYKPEDIYDPEIDTDEGADEQPNNRMQQDRDRGVKRKRRSRWGEKVALPSSVVSMASAQSLLPSPASGGILLSKVTRNDPGLINYVMSTYGSTKLNEETWKKAEDNYKVHLVYQGMLKKKQDLERLQQQGRNKFEYDSDEETDGGTWEHKMRQKEMMATQQWASDVTQGAEGKHHIGDFLPPEEFQKLIRGFDEKKSDYQEHKLGEDNKGFKMLQKLGWSEGKGLGTSETGILEPVNKGVVSVNSQGLGVDKSSDAPDDEYDAYRKRMMLAYKFRPNPLNNPRRAYY